jgi:type IV secretory pathway TraG/TraD family ATPase VirD4
LRPIAMMLDELKYILSTAALQALGTVRDKSCHIMLAHQANGDLEDCGGLDPNAVRGAVLVNTGLKLIYRATEPETLEWAAALSGTIVIKQETSHMQQGMFQAAEGQYRQQERALITPNHILAMPKQTGMFFGAGVCRRIQVSTLPAGPRPAIIPAIPEENPSRTDAAGQQNPSHAAPTGTPGGAQNGNSRVAKPTSETDHTQEIL